MHNKIHQANRKKWNFYASIWNKRTEQRNLWRKCANEPSLVLSKRELHYLGNIPGKQVCVLGSGDNEIVFALSGLGATVTSVDISERQLSNARQRAKELGLLISFVQGDVTDLPQLTCESFEIVYTGGHVAVWISDLGRYYGEAVRILKKDGLLLINEYHPFRRVFRYDSDKLNDYFNRGPYQYDMADDHQELQPGEIPSYEFHWTISDMIQTVIQSGCEIVEVMEFGNNIEEWESAVMRNLPENFLIVGRKK